MIDLARAERFCKAARQTLATGRYFPTRLVFDCGRLAQPSTASDSAQTTGSMADVTSDRRQIRRINLTNEATTRLTISDHK